MKPLLLISLLYFTSITNAATLNCKGTVSNMYITSSGDFVIKTSYRNDYTSLCNVNDDPVVCSLWSSVVTTSMTNEKEIIVRYKDIPSCDAIEKYNSAPKPAYVMLVK